jgi:predicted RNA-binding Zn-ribbon protein involved in translation (DUF1610 family)
MESVPMAVVGGPLDGHHTRRGGGAFAYIEAPGDGGERCRIFANPADGRALYRRSGNCWIVAKASECASCGAVLTPADDGYPAGCPLCGGDLRAGH